MRFFSHGANVSVHNIKNIFCTMWRECTKCSPMLFASKTMCTGFQGYTFQLREVLHASKSMYALLTHMPKPLVPQFNRSVFFSNIQHLIAQLGFSHIEIT